MNEQNLPNRLKCNENLYVLLFCSIFTIVLHWFLSFGIYNFYKYNHGVTDVYFDYTAGLIGSLCLSIILLMLPFKHKKLIFSAWIVKLLIIFVFDYLYEGHYYGLDSYEYFGDSIRDPVYLPIPLEATHNLRVLTTFITNLIYPSYRLCVVVFSFVGLIAQYLFYKASIEFIGHESKKLLIILLFFPSILFWTHILGKDPVVLLLISIYFLGLSNILKNRVLKAIPLIAISLIGFLFFRFWLAGIFGISLALSFFFNKNIKGAARLLLIISITTVTFFMAKIALNYFNIDSLNQFTMMVSGWSDFFSLAGGSAINIKIYSFNELIYSIPYLIFSALFRPLIFEVNNIFQLLAGIENTILVIYFFIALRFFIKNKLYKNYQLVILVIHIVVWSIIYAPNSALNLGTAVRYKLQILPFILAFIYLCFYQNKLQIKDRQISGRKSVAL